MEKYNTTDNKVQQRAYCIITKRIMMYRTGRMPIGSRLPSYNLLSTDFCPPHRSPIHPLTVGFWTTHPHTSNDHLYNLHNMVMIT